MDREKQRQWENTLKEELWSFHRYFQKHSSDNTYSNNRKIFDHKIKDRRSFRGLSVKTI